MRFNALYGIALFLAVIALTGCDQVRPTGLETAVLESRGRVVRNGGITLREGEAVPSRASIKTFPEAEVVLAFLPNVLSHVEGEAELAPGEISLAIDGNETDDGMRARRVDVGLTKGSYFWRTQSHSLSPTVLTIRGAQGVMRAESDALFYTEQRSDGLRVACLRGHIFLRPREGDHESTIWAGESGYLTEGAKHFHRSDFFSEVSEAGKTAEAKMLLAAERRRGFLPW